MNRCFLCIGLVLGLASNLWADEGTACTAEKAHLLRIWSALDAYKKAKGEFPDHLSDLVPEFLPDAQMLLSPSSAKDDPLSAKGKRDPKLPCSYDYGFSAQPMPRAKFSRRDWTKVQLEEYGTIVPILQWRASDESALNVSFAGEFFATSLYWENDKKIQQLLERDGWGPGIQQGKKLIVQFTDPSGHPIPKARVRTSGREWHLQVLPTRLFTADAEGQITVPLEPDDRATVWIESAAAQWYLPGREYRYSDAANPANDVARMKLVLQPTGHIGGVVRDPNGAPLGEATVSFSYQDLPDQPPALRVWVSTDSAGRWVLKNIPQNDPRVEIRVRHAHFRSWILRLPLAPTPVTEALSAQQFDLKLAPLVPVSGRVLSKGQPVPGIRVSLYVPDTTPQETLADAEGRFQLGAPELGPGSIAAFTPDFAPTRVPVKIEETNREVTVEMEAGQPRTLRLLRPGRTPIAGVPVLMVGISSDQKSPLPQEFASWPAIGTTGPDGRLLWNHAPDGTLFLRIAKADGEFINFEWNTRQPQECEIELNE